LLNQKLHEQGLLRIAEGIDVARHYGGETGESRKTFSMLVFLRPHRGLHDILYEFHFPLRKDVLPEQFPEERALETRR
jgi:hypothetical protein